MTHKLVLYKKRTDLSKICRDAYLFKRGFNNKVFFKLPMDTVLSVNFAFLFDVKFMEISAV